MIESGRRRSRSADHGSRAVSRSVSRRQRDAGRTPDAGVRQRHVLGAGRARRASRRRAPAESMRGNVQRDSIALLLALADGSVKARRGGDVTIDGRAMPVLDVDIKPGGPLTLVFDPATGLIRRASDIRGGGAATACRRRRDVLGLPRCRWSQGGVRGDRPPAAASRASSAVRGVRLQRAARSRPVHQAQLTLPGRARSACA